MNATASTGTAATNTAATNTAATTSNLALTILLVADPARSAAFYRDLLGLEPAEQSPIFAMFALPSGAGIGLWSAATTAPPPAAAPGAAELCFREDEVDRLHAAWAARGIRIAQAPTDMDFGRTFVALDPDGHRVRVFRPAPEESTS
ncbi:MAG: VOC family protein [Gemmatimonadales bacterium]|nr:VOC family protein [Gemmatimonadales bacterium]